MSAHVNPRKRILVVEDETSLARLVEMELGKAGFDVAVATDGERGLDMIRTGAPDLVLLDLMLPLVDGFQIIETLAREGILPRLPIIVISISGQSIDIERAIKMGIRDYLVKPNFGLEELLQKVKGFFAKEESASRLSQKEEKENMPTILVVEDDRILVELLEKKAKEERFRVHTAMRADEARKALKEKKVDVILLDLVLPDVDGFTYLRELKEDPRTKDIPVIIVSNLAEEDERGKGLRAGAADYVIKSNVLPQDILRRVKEVIKHKKILEAV